ncbi:MAG: hypothetical protein LBQ08_05045 [Holosporaceae bacterium]|jgi:hypothetical protein|nr:hypothetical protein [Holosporaceae bacterium]
MKLAENSPQEREKKLQETRKWYKEKCEIFGRTAVRCKLLFDSLTFAMEAMEIPELLFAQILRALSVAIENGGVDEEIENEIATTTENYEEVIRRAKERRKVA